jgi:quercetin dioxygenase-like cupin family protein
MKLLALFSLLAAAYSQAPGSSVVYRHANEIEWKVSGSLPPGAEYHLIYEDKATHALQTLVRFPPGYSLPPHSHTHDETLLIVKGKLVIDFGGQSSQTLASGSYAVIPAGVLHSLKAKGELVMMMAVNGPYDIQGLPSLKQ